MLLGVIITIFWCKFYCMWIHHNAFIRWWVAVYYPGSRGCFCLFWLVLLPWTFSHGSPTVHMQGSSRFCIKNLNGCAVGSHFPRWPTSFCSFGPYMWMSISHQLLWNITHQNWPCWPIWLWFTFLWLIIMYVFPYFINMFLWQDY